MGKFYFVTKATPADEVGAARANGFRIADEKFRGEIPAEQHANEVKAKSKPKAKKSAK